ncbi:MAG: efflux transporter outer membrane subunit [Formivibrio sp.]|nr:efflux transporter outer membrane subunit [Formivibrio sp.]
MTPKLACLPLILMLAGCISVGPHYEQPTAATPAQWKNAALIPSSTSASTTDLAHWWQAFNDPVLDRLITTTLAQNLDLKSAQAKLRESRSRAAMTDAALYPSVTANAGAKRSEAHTDANPTKSFNAGLDASWELDIFGANRRASEAAIATVSATQASLHDTEVSLIAEVANVYISLRTLEARYAAAQSSLVSQQETLDLTRWRWQAGLVSELDYIQAESTLAQTRAKLPSLDVQLESARNQLTVLLGVQPAALPDLLAGTGQIPDFSNVTALPIPLDTLRQRPDIRVAERNLAAQTAQVGAAEAARYPTIDLSGTIGLQSAQLGQLLRADSLINSLAASLTAPIFDAGKIRSNIAVQNAVLDQTMATYQKTVLQALADVENALMALAKTEARRTDLRAASAAAETAQTMAQQNYAAGLTDYLTVLDTQRTLLSVQDSLRSAEGDRASALVQLYKALGGGWTSATAEAVTLNQAGEARHD